MPEPTDLIPLLRHIADVADAGGKLHWADAMRRAASELTAAESALAEARAEAERLREDAAWQRFCWKNVRLLAARHRKEEWAQHMLRFCDDAGVKASPLRDATMRGEG